MTEHDTQVCNAVIELIGNQKKLISYKDIALHLGKDPGSTGQSIGQAMKRIHEELGDQIPWWRVLSEKFSIQNGEHAQAQEQKLREEFPNLTITKSKSLLFDANIYAQMYLLNFDLHKDNVKIA